MNTVRNSARKTVTTAVRENDVTRKTRKPTINFYFSLIYLILNYYAFKNFSCLLFSSLYHLLHSARKQKA